jgi:hypothetical protein
VSIGSRPRHCAKELRKRTTERKLLPRSADQRPVGANDYTHKECIIIYQPISTTFPITNIHVEHRPTPSAAELRVCC